MSSGYIQRKKIKKTAQQVLGSTNNATRKKMIQRNSEQAAKTYNKVPIYPSHWSTLIRTYHMLSGLVIIYKVNGIIVIMNI